MIMRAAMPFLDPADSPEVEADWREAVTAAFNDGSLYWIPSAVVDKYFLEGKCPRCKHSMDQVHRIGTYLTELNVRAGGASRRETHETIRTAIVCNCEPDEGPHKDKTLGCGYAPSIEVDVPNPTQEWRLSTPLPAVGPAAKSDRDYWDGLALKAEREQLKAVQDSATKWTAITGTLLGLFGTVAFATGLSAIEDPADRMAADSCTRRHHSGIPTYPVRDVVTGEGCRRTESQVLRRRFRRGPPGAGDHEARSHRQEGARQRPQGGTLWDAYRPDRHSRDLLVQQDATFGVQGRWGHDERSDRLR